MTTNHKNNTKNQNRKNNTSRESSERITAKTLAAVLVTRWLNDLQSGRAPWCRPCYTLEPLAASHDTGRRYSLSNQAILDPSERTEYLTFIQAKKEGGHVIKGAKSSYINYFREWKKQPAADAEMEIETDEAQPEGEETAPRRMLFAQGVFRLDQTEGTRPKWEAPTPINAAAVRSRLDIFRAKFPQIFAAGDFQALATLCKSWDIGTTTKPDDEEKAAAFAFEASIVGPLAAALICKAAGIETPEQAPENSSDWAGYLATHYMKIYSVIARAEKAASAVLKMEEEPKPVKLPQPEPQEETEPEQEQPEPEQTTEPAKMPVYIVTKNKYCEPFPGEALPFKKIPAGALVKLTKAGLTRHEVEIFTGGLFYRAKVKNLLFLEESPAQVWPGLKPEKTEAEQEPTPAAVPQVLTYEKPQPVTTCAPLRAILLDDDDDDDADMVACQLVGLNL